MTSLALAPDHDTSDPALPRPRGPLSAMVIDVLRGDAAPGRLNLALVDHADPYGEDLTLALHICYEPHYRGSALVEWQPELLRLRACMERSFLGALRSNVDGGDDVPAALAGLLVAPVHGDGSSHYLRDNGSWSQLRELFVHRSIWHLKQADAQLFANLMTGAGLDARYLHYQDQVPAPAIATVNLMSMLGLHRTLRGALVGQRTAAAITTSPSAHRMVQAIQRHNASPDCARFYTEHIEADAVHEQVMRRDVVGDLLASEPELARDVVFGVQATELLESYLTRHLLTAWRAGTTSLLQRAG